MNDVRFEGFVPYLHVEDAAAALEWYSRVFGFEEKARWTNDDGVVHNAEMGLGQAELWLDGGGLGYWERKGRGPEQWIGLWVDDPDAMYERVKRAGLDVEPPEDKPFGVRTFQAADPDGYVWGFMRRLASRREP